MDEVVPVETTVVGDLRLHPFESRIFRNERTLRVWLPPRYDAPENAQRRYPVLYLNDGQNLFDKATAYGGVEWRVGETADRLIRQEEVVPLVIVGIDNAQNDRIKEYLPFRSYSPAVLRPQGKSYPNFLVDEVMPFIEGQYRIATEPKNMGLGGSSLGGLITLYTAIARPGVFDRLLIESPSLFISNRRVLRFASKFQQWPGKIFLAIGTREAGREEFDRKAVEDVQTLEHILRDAGLGADQVRVWIDEGASHNEGEWAKRFPEALKFLFGAG
jgi:predicted alpha/beta superfamily hydrolase